MQTSDPEIEISLLRGSNLTTTVRLGSLTVLEDGGQQPAGWNCWRLLTSRDGDKRVVWDPESFAQIRDAKAMFNELVGQGMVPYVCGPSGARTPEIMEEFDCAAGEVVFIPIGAVAGGSQ